MFGKFILVLFVCINIATLVGSSVCAEQVNQCDFGENAMLRLFISENNLNNIDSTIETQGGIGLQDNFTDSINDITKEQSGGTSLIDGFVSFLDGLKMVLGLLALLTPLPLLAFIASVGMPLIFVIGIGFIPVLLYIIAIMEFIRGASF